MPIPDIVFTPALASLMEKRGESLLLGGLATVQFGLVTAGLPGWPCPFKAAFGIPCPGCGLSTAVGLLLRGHWQAAIQVHAFAPLCLLGLALVLGVGLLPGGLRAQAIQNIAAFERRTGITAILFAGFMLYWGFRLLHL